jgi:hypothetical protein
MIKQMLSAVAVNGVKHIDIRPVNELRRVDVEFLHEIVELANTAGRRFIDAEDGFQLEKVTQPLDFVEVHARPADEIQRAVFYDPADLAIGLRQQLPQRVRRGNLRYGIRGLLGARLIGAVIEYELAAAVGKRSFSRPAAQRKKVSSWGISIGP